MRRALVHSVLRSCLSRHVCRQSCTDGDGGSSEEEIAPEPLPLFTVHPDFREAKRFARRKDTLQYTLL